MKNTITISFFGQFRLQSDTGSLSLEDISSKKLTHLLTYILVHHNQTIPTQEFIDVLWTEDDSDNPAGALKNLIYRMRKTLKQHLGPWPLILTKHNAYSWNPDIELSMDTEYFESLIHKSKSPICTKPQQMALLLEAVKLYHGQFMNACLDEHWMISLGAYYHTLYLETVLSLTKSYEEIHDYEAMVQTARLGLSIDDLDENLHMALMNAYIYQGKYHMALTHYKNAAAQLKNSLGIDAPPSFRKLYARIMSLDAPKHHMTWEELQTSLLRDLEPEGAFFCDYTTFKDICQLQIRCPQKQKSYILLLTCPSTQTIPKLLNILTHTLRLGDVVSQMNDEQLIALIPADKETTIQNLAKRAMQTFYQESRHKNIQIQYDIHSINE